MKIIFKVLFIILLCILAILIYVIIQTPKYASLVVGPHVLSSSDLIVLREKGIVKGLDDIVLMYSQGDISESGCLIKIDEIVCYEPGQHYIQSDHVTFDSILNVKYIPTNSIMTESRIDLMKIDSSVITICINHSNNSDYKFYNKIIQMKNKVEK